MSEDEASDYALHGHAQALKEPEDSERKNTVKAYYNAFPNSERNKSDKRDFGDILKDAKIVLDMLEPISELHVAAQAAFSAFKVFLQFELDRRENDSRILVVVEAQTDMMSTLLLMKDVKDPERRTPDGVPLSSKIKQISKRVQDAIRLCGSDVDCYYKESALKKWAKAKDWKTILQDYIKKFQDFKVDFLVALQLSSVKSSEEKLNEIITKLDESFQHQNTFEKALFAKFGKLNEDDLLRPKNMSLLTAVVDFTLAKESSGNLNVRIGRDGKAAKSDLESKEETRKVFIQELQEPLEKLLKKNLETYEGKLKLQMDEVLGSINSLGQRLSMDVAKAFENQKRSVRHEFRDIWTKMNWHYCVERRAFVLGLHEYYSDAFFLEDEEESVPPSPMLNIDDFDDTPHFGYNHSNLLLDIAAETNAPPPRHLMDNSLKVPDPREHAHEELTVSSIVVENVGMIPRRWDEQSHAGTVAESLKKQVRPEDAWTVTFISSQYMHDIGDAIDEDSSGFITQREANQFVSLRPLKYSLPVWIAYWAAGWTVEANIYRNRIKNLLDNMWSLGLETAKFLPENRDFVMMYLASYNLADVDVLCRMSNNTSYPHQKLEEIAEFMMKHREEVMTKRLESVKYIIDDESTLRLIGGKQRIEIYLLPLVYLILKHHYDVALLCTKRIVDPLDLRELEDQFDVIFDTVEARITKMEERAIRQHDNPRELFDKFSDGIYKDLYPFIKGLPLKAPSSAEIRERLQDRPGPSSTMLPEFSTEDIEKSLKRPCQSPEEFRALLAPYTEIIEKLRSQFAEKDLGVSKVVDEFADMCYKAESHYRDENGIKKEGDSDGTTIFAKAGDGKEELSVDIVKVLEEMDVKTRLAVQRTARIQPFPYHADITCDVCDKESAIGTRYRCLECDDFDLCEECFAKEKSDTTVLNHLSTHNMLKTLLPIPPWFDYTRTPEVKIILRNFMLREYKSDRQKCSKCQKQGFNGPLFKCLECTNIMCSECERKFCAENTYDDIGKTNQEHDSEHDITHRVLIINDCDIEKYKREEIQELEQDMDIKAMVVDIKKRLEKLESSSAAADVMMRKMQELLQLFKPIAHADAPTSKKPFLNIF